MDGRGSFKTYGLGLRLEDGMEFKWRVEDETRMHGGWRKKRLWRRIVKNLSDIINEEKMSHTLNVVNRHHLTYLRRDTVTKTFCKKWANPASLLIFALFTI